MSNAPIDSLELRIVSDSKKATASIDALIASLDKLKDATKGIGLGGFSVLANKVSKSTDKMSASNKKSSDSFINLAAKVTVAYMAVRKIGFAIYSTIEKSMDFTENMNLFSVSMGEYAESAYEYAEKVSGAMGIDTSEWIRAQGVFMTLSTGFGVAGDRANKMSQNLTQLGYDLSSFFNISTEDAMQKLQSGLSGELEPLRRLGYDLSQAKLEATAFELGIEKSVSAMTQAEKAQLRYYAIMTQVTRAQGDMGRTLDDPANQVRVFKAQLSMAAREIGNIFIPSLNAILPYATAVAKVIGLIGKTLAGLFGHKSEGVTESTLAVVENTDTVTENLSDAQAEAKKLKSYMMGIDELNVINPNEGSSSEDTSAGFEFELPEYDFLDGLVESKVATIVEEMKEWLGLTEEVDTWSELLETRLGRILKTVGLIGTGIAAWKVTTGFIDSIKLISTLLSKPSYAIAIGLTLTISGLTFSFDAMKDAIKNGLEGFNFAEIIGGALLGAGGAAIFGSSLATWIETAFSCSAIDLIITQAGINLGVGTVGAAGAALAAGAVGIVAGIPMLIVGIYDASEGTVSFS